MAGDFIKDVVQHQARLNQVQNQLKTVNANIDKNSKATAQNKTDTATNTAALKDANKAVETSTANLEKLGQSKTGVQDEIDALNKQMSEVGEDDAQTKASYESQITDKEAELKAFDEEMKQAEKEAEEAKNDVKTYEAKDKELTKAAQDYDTEKANLEAEKAICEAEVEELENEIEKAKADAKADAENYQGGLASDGEDIASRKAAGGAMPVIGSALKATGSVVEMKAADSKDATSAKLGTTYKKDEEAMTSTKVAGQAMPIVGQAMSATQLQNAKIKH